MAPWASSSWMAGRGAPPSGRGGGKLWGIARGGTPGALGEEEGLRARVGGEGMAAAVQVAPQRRLGRLADRQQPLLRSLAENAQLLALEVHPPYVAADDLLATQAAGIGELEH